ncbi:DUF2290 domain-containing protein [Microbacterium sp. NPDC089321]|uniref:DUF2290 domain-containing protein n=1 Tax=Microbacterium sp. NPDC089321 TaxID=3155183 RepID=UPI0034357780
MTTPRAVATELNQLFDYLESKGIVYYWNPIDEAPQHVSWHSTTNEPFLSNHDDISVASYIYWLRNGMYSAVLADGSLLQITYFFDGNRIMGHRLAFVPCPVTIDQSMVADGLPLADVVELHLATADQVLMKSMIRFDFDPLNARPRHPEAHLTLNSIECRIACVSPLRIGRFIDFVFRNFYPTFHEQDPYLQQMPQSGWFDNTIVEDDRRSLHVAWAG